MNAVVRQFVLFGCFVLVVTPALANAPAPEPRRPPGLSARMVLEVNESGDTQLRIPAGLLSESTDFGSDTSRLRTIVAGIALSVAAISFVFVRRRTPARRAAVVVLVLAATLGIAGVVSLSAAPPPQPSPSRQESPSRQQAAVPEEPRGVEVRVVSTSDQHITLSISREVLEQLMAKPKEVYSGQPSQASEGRDR